MTKKQKWRDKMRWGPEPVNATGCVCPACSPHPDPGLVNQAASDPETLIGQEVLHSRRVRVHAAGSMRDVISRIWVRVLSVRDDGNLEGEVVGWPYFVDWDGYDGPRTHDHVGVCVSDLEHARPPVYPARCA